MTAHSPEMNVKGFKKLCISNAVDDDMFWNDNEEDGDVRCVRKMEALPVKLETVALIDR
jgi:hypothetical protein